MSREIYGMTCGSFAVPAGASLSLYVTPTPGEIWSRLKYASGGSLEIMGASLAGVTGLAGAAGTGYLFGAAEAVEFTGPARYFLQATGATAVAYFIKGLSQGN